MEKPVTSPTNRFHISRRELITSAGSVALVTGLRREANAQQPGTAAENAFTNCSPAPVHIPGGFNGRDVLGPRFPDRILHLFLPGSGTEPSTIFNLQARVGIMNIHGTGTRTELNPFTGMPVSETPNLPFAADFRFMQGKYVGVEGVEHEGTFAFFWLDVFETGHQFGDVDFQLADHNPGISQTGLFWTMPIPAPSVNADPISGKADACLSDAQMPDFGNLLGSVWGGGAEDGQGRALPPVFGSTVSIEAHWFNLGSKQLVRDPVNRFVYENSQSDAKIRWTSLRRGARFATDSGPQTVLFAAVGLERSGVFFS